MLSHFTCHKSNAYFDPRYMLNNICFHVYAQKSLFIDENGNYFFLQPHPFFPLNLYFGFFHLKIIKYDSMDPQHHLLAWCLLLALG